MKKYIVVLLMELVVIHAFAYDFKAGDLFYNIINDSIEPYTVEVTCENEGSSINYLRLYNANVYSTVFYNDTIFTVTRIGDYAFNDCDGLYSISLPNTIVSIGEHAFAYCTGLSSIVIPETVTSIGDHAFEYCNGLTSLNIPVSVNSIGSYAFAFCIGLSSVVIPNTVTSIGFGAFSGVESITYVGTATGSPWGASKVVSVCDENFEYSDIEKTKISKYLSYNTEAVIPNTVISIGDNAFSGCSYLKSVIIPNTVTSIGSNAFAYCAGLTSIEIGDSVKFIGDRAFANCIGLDSIVIPDSIVSIGVEAFANCINLESLIIPNSVTSIGDKAFNLIKNIVYGGDIAEGKPWGAESLCVVREGDFAFADVEKTILTEYFGNSADVVIPKSAIIIRDKVFSDCFELESVTMPESVKYIGNEAFYFCKKLKSVVIPDSVKSIGNHAFSFCDNLSELSLPNSLDSIGEYAFSNTGLSIVNVPNGVRYIGYEAFGGIDILVYDGRAVGKPWGAGLVCVLQDGDFLYDDTIKTQLTKYIGDSVQVIIPNTVVDICQEAFRNCNNLKSAVIPNSVKTIGNNAFENSKNLTNVEISGSVTTIGKNAFAGCSSLRTVVIPDSVRQIGTDAFKGVTNIVYHGSATYYDWNERWGAFMLNGFVDGDFIYSDSTMSILLFYIGEADSVAIPNTVKVIEEDAFLNCSRLASVVIPKSVESIGSGTFSGCSGINNLAVPETVTSIGKNAFGGVLNVFYNGPALFDVPDDKNWGAKYLNCIVEGDFVYSDSTKKRIEKYIGKDSYAYVSGSVIVIGEKAFAGCTGLTSVVISESVTTICEDAFSGCKALSSLDVPESVKTIGARAFQGCSCLLSVSIPESVDSIGENAFYKVKNIVYGGDAVFSDSDYAWGALVLNGIVDGDFIFADAEKTILAAYIGKTANVDIPSNVTAIAERAFYDCSNLYMLSIPESVATIGADAFGGSNNAILLCEAVSKPEGWSYNWNSGNNQVVWLGVGMSSNVAQAVNIYAHHNVIVVENADADIYVYDATGRLVVRRVVAPNVSIAMPREGLYIVKVGAETKRVVVSQN